MDSTPPASTMSCAPDITAWAAKCRACCEEPHCRSIEVPGTDSGRRDASTALRATLVDCSPTWLTQPRNTSSTSAGSMPVRSSTAWMTWAASSTGCQPARRPPRRPADGPVEADALAVEVAVEDQAFGQLGVFDGLAQALGEGHRGGQGGFHVLGRALQQRGVEDAGQDGVDADALVHQVARDRQGHAHDAGLGGGVGGLADLTVLRGHRGGVDDGAPVAVGQRGQGEHAGSRLGDAAEGTHQVDLDDAVEVGQRKVPDLARGLVAAGGLDGVAGAGTVDQHALLPVGGAGKSEAGIDLLFRGHVHPAEHPTDLARQRFALVGVEVEQGHFDAVAGQAPCGGGPQARGPSGDDGGNAGIELHGGLLDGDGMGTGWKWSLEIPWCARIVRSDEMAGEVGGEGWRARLAGKATGATEVTRAAGLVSQNAPRPTPTRTTPWMLPPPPCPPSLAHPRAASRPS